MQEEEKKNIRIRRKRERMKGEDGIKSEIRTHTKKKQEAERKIDR